MKRILALALVATVVFTSCNKQKRVMKGLVGNWTIEQSERFVLTSGGSEDKYEDLTNCGDLVISDIEGSDDPSMKNFVFTYYGSNGDTMKVSNILYTDDKNKRMVFKNALCDTNEYCNLIWTCDKTKRNKQIWSAYGVDTTFFYPTNKYDPSNANNWLMWRITLKRND